MKPASAELSFIAAQQSAIEELETAEKIIRLTDNLEDLDDVQNVYTNADIAAEILEKL